MPAIAPIGATAGHSRESGNPGSRSQNMYIIDFDDTLFNTEAFKLAKLEAAMHLGISEKVFWEAYHAPRENDEGAYVYTSELHAKELAKRGFDEIGVLSVLKKVDAQIAQFVFPDTIDFLIKMKSLKKPMVLLSLGSPEYIRKKVAGAGIEKYFDKIIVVDKTKTEALGDLLKESENQDIWLVNDKPNESMQLKQQFPDINFILKKSKKYSDEEYVKSGIPSFSSLHEIYEFIRK